MTDGDVTILWHMRLRQISENCLTELSRRGLLDGQGYYCEHCVFRKQRQVKFTKSIHNTKGTLDYLHSDLWEHLECLLTKVLIIC